MAHEKAKRIIMDTASLVLAAALAVAGAGCGAKKNENEKAPGAPTNAGGGSTNGQTNGVTYAGGTRYVSVNDLSVVHSPLTAKDYYTPIEIPVKSQRTMFTQKEEWVYFGHRLEGNYSSQQLIKMKANGDAITAVDSADWMYDLSVWGDYIYYSTIQMQSKRFRADGTGPVELFTDGCMVPFSLTPKGFFYSMPKNAEDSFKPGRPDRYVWLDYDGNVLVQKELDAISLCISGDYAFFMKDEDDKYLLYRMDLDGGNEIKLHGNLLSGTGIIALENGYVYFMRDSSGGYSLCRVSFSGTDFKDYGIHCGSHLGDVVHNNTLYYTGKADGGNASNTLSRINLDTGEVAELLVADENTWVDFNIIGNWIFICIDPSSSPAGKYKYICRLSLDGSVFETIARLPRQ